MTKLFSPDRILVTGASGGSVVRWRGIMRKAHVVLPWPFVLLRLLDRLLPQALRERLLLALTPPGR